MSPQRLNAQPPSFDFDADNTDIPAVGPTFTLGGEEFRCVGMPAGEVLNRFVAASRVNTKGQQVFALPDLCVFIEDLLVDELPIEMTTASDGEQVEGEAVTVDGAVKPVDDKERWAILMADNKRPVKIEVLAKAAMSLFQWYTDRPTSPPTR